MAPYARCNHNWDQFFDRDIRKRGPIGAGATPVRETLRTPITRRIGSDYAMGASLQHGARIDTPFQAEVN